jgi:hypothetical protein
MNSFSKIVASVAVGAVVIAAGSAYAVMSTGGDVTTAWRNTAAVPFTQGFSNATGWNCANSGNGGNGALSFRDRWNGNWEFANNDFTSFTWATCRNGWAAGYLNIPQDRMTTVAQAPRVN